MQKMQLKILRIMNFILKQRMANKCFTIKSSDPETKKSIARLKTILGEKINA